MKIARVIAGCMIAGLLFLIQEAAADKSVAPVRAEPAKAVLPVEVKAGDLRGEGENVVAKLVLPARLREGDGKAGKMGLNDDRVPTQRSLVAAVALALAAFSAVFVVRGKGISRTSKAVVLGVMGLLACYGAAWGDALPGRPKAQETKIVVEFSADVTDAVLTLSTKR